MDYERLARTLLRILAVWLVVGSLSEFISGVMTTMRFTGLPGSTVWTYPVTSGVTIVTGFVLFFCSGRFAKFVAA